MKKATDQLKTNPFGVVEAVAEIAGEDESFFDVYIQQALAIAKTLQDLTPEQQKAVFATRKLEIAKKRLEAEKSQINESRAKTEQVVTVQRQIETKMAELGISDPELSKAYDIVRDLDEAQGLEPLRLADLCFQYVMKVERPFQQVERVLPKVLPKEAHTRDLVEALVDIVREEPLTDSELTEIVKQYSQRASSPTKGKAPAPSASKATAKAKPKAKKEVSEVKVEKGRLSQTAKIAQINRRLRRGDVRKVAEKTGFTEGFVSTVISGMFPNERIVNCAFNMVRGRKTNEQMMKK
jgi:hypothetical protein